MDYNFFHRPKPKQFEYKPRYYNPDTDTGKPAQEKSGTDEFAHKLHNSWKRKRTRPEKKGLSTNAIIWIVIILAFLLYFILK